MRPGTSPFFLLFALLLPACTVDETLNPRLELRGDVAGWSQWGRDASHDGSVGVVAQAPARALASAVFDPFVRAEKADSGGDILVHYQAPLVDGDDVFMAFKSGSYTPCDPPYSGKPAPCGSDTWSDESWGEKRYAWRSGALEEIWSVTSDWKPVPDKGGLGEWEPVFHAVLAGSYVVMPAANGGVLVLSRETGAVLRRIDPFGDVNPNRYVAGPLTLSEDGHVYYNVITFGSADDPWSTDLDSAWIVAVDPQGATTKAPYASLVAAPATTCRGSFGKKDLPWPPAPDAVPAEFPCGGLRPGVNVAPAIGPDGTIYTVARPHFGRRYGFLVALAADLSLKWSASLRGRLADGCNGAAMPKTGDPGGCRLGAKDGVDPATNEAPAGIIEDSSTASPVVAPDGTVLYGAYTRYNYSRGHLFHFDAAGGFLGAYDFGWDVTPAIYRHDGTYSIILKDNAYEIGSYCNDEMICPPTPGGPHRITQLGAGLDVEWSFTSTNTMSCVRDDSGKVTCTDDHPTGFEWCINAPAVDARGAVFANSEDGLLYAIEPGGGSAKSLFLGESVGAAYTPLSIDASGRVYAENLGTLFAVGQ